MSNTTFYQMKSSTFRKNKTKNKTFSPDPALPRDGNFKQTEKICYKQNLQKSIFKKIGKIEQNVSFCPDNKLLASQMIRKDIFFSFKRAEKQDVILFKLLLKTPKQEIRWLLDFFIAKQQNSIDIGLNVQHIMLLRVKHGKKYMRAESQKLLDNGIFDRLPYFKSQSTHLKINNNQISSTQQFDFLTHMTSTIQRSKSPQLCIPFDEIANFPLCQQFEENWNNQKENQKMMNLVKNTCKTKTMTPMIMKKVQRILNYEKLIHSNVSELIMKQFIVNLYRGAKYSMKALRGLQLDVVLKKKVILNEINGSTKKFLFLDLDETLIYTNREKNTKLYSNQQSHFQLYIRPYAHEFLQSISKYYDVYVFTAATREYAEAAIQKLNRKKKVIQDLLCRDDCFRTQRGKLIKDLRIVGNRSLKDMVLVDNKAESFGLQIDNGVPILDFYGSKNDVELVHLEELLIKFSQAEDVRPAIREHFRLRDLAELSKEDLQDYLLSGSSLGRLEKNFANKGHN